MPKNTAGMTPGGQSTWYKSGVAYDTKQTGPAAIPPENLLDMTRKQKASEQPKPSHLEELQFKIGRKLLQLIGYLRLNLEPLIW